MFSVATRQCLHKGGKPGFPFFFLCKKNFAKGGPWPNVPPKYSTAFTQDYSTSNSSVVIRAWPLNRSNNWASGACGWGSAGCMKSGPFPSWQYSHLLVRIIILSTFCRACSKWDHGQCSFCHYILNRILIWFRIWGQCEHKMQAHLWQTKTDDYDECIDDNYDFHFQFIRPKILWNSPMNLQFQTFSMVILQTPVRLIGPRDDGREGWV